MIRLQDQPIQDQDYVREKQDLLRIQKALFILRGIYCTLDECGNMWQNHSWSVAASWISVPGKPESIIAFIESSYGFKSYAQWAIIEEE